MLPMPHARRGNASPLLLGAAGLLAGAAVGYAVKHLTTDPVAIVVQQPEVVKQELSPEELENLCSEPLDDERMNLAKAQAKVVDLQAQLQARESELGKLKGQVEVDEQKRAAAARRWKEMESEIEQLKTDLAQAESERDEVMVELKTTIRKLERQIRETEKAKAEADFYKNESTVNLWSAFVAQAKVEICDRGTRKRHEKCHEAVAGALDKMSKDRFRECVDTYQATRCSSRPRSGRTWSCRPTASGSTRTIATRRRAGTSSTATPRFQKPRSATTASAASTSSWTPTSSICRKLPGTTGLTGIR